MWRWGREEVWDVEQSEGGWGGAGNGIWSVKNELQIKLNFKSLYELLCLTWLEPQSSASSTCM